MDYQTMENLLLAGANLDLDPSNGGMPPSGIEKLALAANKGGGNLIIRNWDLPSDATLVSIAQKAQGHVTFVVKT